MTSSVTVLIPAHGSSPYISETLMSIEQNTLRPLEVLIVNDGLSESASTKIKEFRDRLPIKILKNEGSGLVDALNTGLHSALGQFICRIDGDDLMFPNRIEKQLELLEMNNEFVAVGSQCMYINRNSEKVGISNYPIGNLNDNPKFQKSCLIAHPSTMYHLHSALSIGGYRSIFTWNGTDIAEDFDFWLRLSALGNIFISDEVLTKYRQHDGQISSKSLIGQLLGTPYVSLINRSDLEIDAIKIQFQGNQSTKLHYYLAIIKKYLGFRTYLAIMLTLIDAKQPNWFGQSFSRRFLLRIINLLNS